MRLMSFGTGLAAASLALSACDRGTPVPSASPPVAAPTSSGPAADIKPHSGELPQSSAPAGPAEGGTAIGGMSGGKQDGGASKGGAPAPTGGDGATPTPETESAKK